MALDFDPGELAAHLQRTARLVAAFYEDLEARPVSPRVDRAALRAAFAGTLGESGVGVDAALDDVEQLVIPSAMGTPHPAYLGLVNSSPLPGGMAADLVVSALNNNGGAYHQSPSMTSAEEEVIGAFRALLDLDERFVGMTLAGGTLCTQQALQLARDRAFPEWQRHGPVGLAGAPRLYTSDASHFSVSRSALTIGVGADGVRSVATTGRGAIDVERLEEAVQRDLDEGRRPFCVVATVGTTGTGAIDDLAAVADVCERRDLWMHVDACYGGPRRSSTSFARALPDSIEPTRSASMRTSGSSCR